VTARPHDLELLESMVFQRRFEERCAELYQQTRIRGFLHLYVGQEAVATGVMAHVQPDDAVVGTYREHVHALLKGVPAWNVMAEMFGRVDGCCGGRGGSMHLFSAPHRFYGGNAIVAAGLPLAVGLGLADQLLQRPNVTVCFFGDGAMAEGDFHEAMNLAALWNVPVLFVCENNRYAMGTVLEHSHAATDLARRAGSYGMASVAVDGMDVHAVWNAAADALHTVRHGGGPMFMECLTYRFRAHSMYDPQRYRTRDEVKQWQQRDPITVLGNALRARGELDDISWNELVARVDAAIEDAVTRADASPLEPVEHLTRDVLTPTVGVGS
jgi:pyruvate dehydrogenase E1 component alpha subunit